MKSFVLYHFENNPRQITKNQFERLKETMSKFGDLSGIVVNLKERDGQVIGELIGGNQRSEAAKFINSEPVIIEEYNEPLEDGTIAYGYYKFEEKRFNARFVRWDEQTALEANLIANAGGGSWDFDAIANIDPGILASSGFDDEMLKEMSTGIGALYQLLASQEDHSSIRSLEDLMDEYGNSQEDDFYPIIKIKVTPEIKKRFDMVMKQMPGSNEQEKFNAIISSIKLS